MLVDIILTEDQSIEYIYLATKYGAESKEASIYIDFIIEDYELLQDAIEESTHARIH